MNPALEALIGSVRTVYSLPASLNRLTECVNDPYCSMADVADVLMSDQALSARMLQLANSSFYGFPAKIETISHAITMIGCQELLALVQGTCVTSVFAQVPVGMVNMTSFWKHSVACGVTARMLAAQRREANTERFFLIGLVHDIGRLVLLQHRTEATGRILQTNAAEGGLLYLREEEEFGFNHADVGHALLQAWQLPPRLLEAVKLHHRFDRHAVYPAECAIVHLADVIVHSMQIGSSGQLTVPPLQPAAWDLVGIAPDTLGALSREIERQLVDVLQVMLGHP